jgi:hypothetical protein
VEAGPSIQKTERAGLPIWLPTSFKTRTAHFKLVAPEPYGLGRLTNVMISE